MRWVLVAWRWRSPAVSWLAHCHDRRRCEYKHVAGGGPAGDLILVARHGSPVHRAQRQRRPALWRGLSTTYNVFLKEPRQCMPRIGFSTTLGCDRAVIAQAGRGHRRRRRHVHGRRGWAGVRWSGRQASPTQSSMAAASASEGDFPPHRTNWKAGKKRSHSVSAMSTRSSRLSEEAPAAPRSRIA
jgi:hypothetical protein